MAEVSLTDLTAFMPGWGWAALFVGAGAIAGMLVYGGRDW